MTADIVNRFHDNMFAMICVSTMLSPESMFSMLKSADGHSAQCEIPINTPLIADEMCTTKKKNIIIEMATPPSYQSSGLVLGSETIPGSSFSQISPWQTVDTLQKMLGECLGGVFLMNPLRSRINISPSGPVCARKEWKGLYQTGGSESV